MRASDSRLLIAPKRKRISSFKARILVVAKLKVSIFV